MDARRIRIRRLVDGLAVVALAALVLVGLWQGYGAWLIATVRSHGG